MSYYYLTIFFNWVQIFFPGAESDGEKKVGNYEPIDYEEELDFSLRVPSRLGDPDAISQISHDQVEQTIEKPATAVQPGQFLWISFRFLVKKLNFYQKYLGKCRSIF